MTTVPILIPILPSIVIFTIESLLIPIDYDRFNVPDSQLSNEQLIESIGQTIKYYPDIPAILEKLNKSNIMVTIFYDDESGDSLSELLYIFNWEKYLSYKVMSFQDLYEASRIKYDRMMFFDCNLEKVHEALLLGIFSVYTKRSDGITMKLLEQSLRYYNMKQRDERKTGVLAINSYLSEKTETCS